MSAIVHVLWSPQTGPICAYADPALAWEHARTMLGVEVSSVDVRSELPEIAKGNLGEDYESDDPTPVQSVSLDDIEDVK